MIETDGIGFDESVATVIRAIREAAAGLTAHAEAGRRDGDGDGR